MESDIQEILAYAMEQELEAKAFYAKVAPRMANATVKEIFAQLASDEMGHYELLKSIKNNPKMIAKIAPRVPDYKIAESEAVPKLSIDMSLRSAIALAMKKEQHAVEIYQMLASQTSDNVVHSTFENLAAMELGHKNRLETIFVDIGYPEVF